MPTTTTTWTDAAGVYLDQLAAGTPAPKAPAKKAPAKKAAAAKKRAR